MEESKKRTRKKKEENVTQPQIEEVSTIIDEVMKEELKETKEETNPSAFTSEEKLYIVKLISQGYRPFDIVKKAHFTLKLSEEKMKKLSLNVRTVEQLINAMEG